MTSVQNRFFYIEDTSPPLCRKLNKETEELIKNHSKADDLIVLPQKFSFILEHRVFNIWEINQNAPILRRSIRGRDSLFPSAKNLENIIKEEGNSNRNVFIIFKRYHLSKSEEAISGCSEAEKIQEILVKYKVKQLFSTTIT